MKLLNPKYVRPLLTALAAVTVGAAALAQPLVRPAQFGGGNPEAQSGGSITYATVDMPTTFNPFTVRILSNSKVINLTLPSLVTFNGATLQYECFLCSDFEINEDGLSVEYTLREGVSWSDGNPITAEDVLTSITLHSSPDINSNLIGSFALGGEPVIWEQTGERTLRQTLPQVDAAALDLAIFPIVPGHIFGPAWEEGGAQAVLGLWDVNESIENLVSGGPFMIREYKINEELTLVRNPNYFVVDEFGTQLPYLDRLIYIGASDPNAVLNAFLSGETHIYSAELIDGILSISDAIDSGRINAVLLPNAAASANPSTLHANFQNTDEFKTELFRDVRFRRAISHLVDRQSIIDLALGGLGTPLYGPFSSGNTRFYNEEAFVEGETMFPYDPEAAAELLAELGFTSRNAAGMLQDDQGRTISFVILANASEPVQRVAGQIITEDMREAGISVTVSIVDTGSVINPARRNFDEDGNRSFDWMFTNFGATADPPTRRNLYHLNGTGRVWNMPLPGASEPAHPEEFEVRLHELTEAALQTYDEAERYEIYTELQRVAGANLPLVYLYTPALSFARMEQVGNTQDQLEDPVTSFEGHHNGGLGQLVNFIDTIYVR